MNTMTIAFTDNPVLKGQENKYEIIEIDATKAIKSWKLSLFSFEWLTPEGDIRQADELPVREREKRQLVEQNLKEGTELERPVLGIGLMDNVEIGAGKAVFLTLAAQGQAKIPVHIPKSNAKEFARLT